MMCHSVQCRCRVQVVLVCRLVTWSGFFQKEAGSACDSEYGKYSKVVKTNCECGKFAKNFQHE